VIYENTLCPGSPGSKNTQTIWVDAMITYFFLPFIVHVRRKYDCWVGFLSIIACINLVAANYRSIVGLVRNSI